MKRREFLVKGGAAAAGMAALGAASDPNAPPPAPAPQPGPTAPQPGAAAGPALPPPPGGATYLSRMESARAVMREAKAAALVETPGTNLQWLAGLDLFRSERLIAFVLPADGDPVVLGPAFERDRLTGSPANIGRIETWEEDENPFDALEKILRKAGAAEGKVVIGGRTWYDDFARLDEKLPKLSFVSSSAVVGWLRERKSPEEVSFIQAAIDITERAIAQAFKEVREGMREDELDALINARIRDRGARGDGLVQFGPRSAVPHNPTSDRRLAAGDVVLVDFGAEVNGYWSDISRTAVLGRATGRMKLVHQAIRQAQDLALQRAKPGEPCAALDQIAKATLGGHGFHRFVLHRLGHGVGLDGHEPPWLTVGNVDRLAAGHVATLEPGVYTPGEYGVRVEDMMVVETDGGRLLSHPPEAMIEL